MKTARTDSLIALSACLAATLMIRATVFASPDDDAKIAAIAAHSACASQTWKQRGRAPRGFIKGMAVSYAKSYCDLRGGKEPVRSVIAGKTGNSKSDALVLYGRDQGTDLERLRAVHALAIGEGMRESSGNTSVGYDRTIQHQTAEIAEAGLFQVSHDSIGRSPWLSKLYAQYKANPADCRLDTFMEGVKDRKASVIGGGAGAEFQAFTKSCPAFAVAYATLLFRINRNHFGPIKRKQAELLPACEEMLRSVEGVAEASCQP